MNIKEKRRRAGRVSQIELAQLSGVSRFRISLAESGYVDLLDHEQRAIEQALVSEVRRRARDLSVRPGTARNSGPKR